MMATTIIVEELSGHIYECKLENREVVILHYVAMGLTTTQISMMLHTQHHNNKLLRLAESTIRTYLGDIYDLLGLKKIADTWQTQHPGPQHGERSQRGILISWLAENQFHRQDYTRDIKLCFKHKDYANPYAIVNAVNVLNNMAVNPVSTAVNPIA